MGAAGAIEAIFSILAINNNVAPPTINLDRPSKGCDLNYSAHTATETKIINSMSNSFGFGGTNATLIFSEYILDLRYFLFITLSLTAIFSFIALKLNANFSLEKDLLIYIEPGKSSSNIALHLAEKNLTNHPFFLVQYLRLIGKSNSLKSGEYSISNEEDLIDLVSKITEGKYYYRKIQLLEGMRFTEIIELIKKTEGLILNLGKFPEKNILLDLNLTYISPEGIFAPETYFFKK